jgi:hypothetical protein
MEGVWVMVKCVSIQGLDHIIRDQLGIEEVLAGNSGAGYLEDWELEILTQRKKENKIKRAPKGKKGRGKTFRIKHG